MDPRAIAALHNFERPFRDLRRDRFQRCQAGFDRFRHRPRMVCSHCRSGLSMRHSAFDDFPKICDAEQVRRSGLTYGVKFTRQPASGSPSLKSHPSTTIGPMPCVFRPWSDSSPHVAPWPPHYSNENQLLLGVVPSRLRMISRRIVYTVGPFGQH